jgi:hypothetical protein
MLLAPQSSAPVAPYYIALDTQGDNPTRILIMGVKAKNCTLAAGTPIRTLNPAEVRKALAL